MSFDCANCGFRNNEIKGGGAIPTLGTEVRLLVRSPADLKRDVLKSDSSAVLIPELDLELVCGTLGGMYTTVEGLLTKIHKSLHEQHAYQMGDSKILHHSNNENVNSSASNFTEFLDKLLSFSKGESLPFEIVLHDPLGNSFISAPLGSFIPVAEDEGLSVVDFERSDEDNDQFGLLDMNTKDFEVVPENMKSDAQIYADRVTRTVQRGEDHPSFFAKGCDDNTAGGVFMSTTAETQESESTGTVPEGYRAMKVNEQGEFLEEEQ